MKSNGMMKKRSIVIVVSVLLILVTSLVFFRNDTVKYIGKTNNIDLTQLTAGSKGKTNIIKLESSTKNGIILCEKYEAFELSNNTGVTSAAYDDKHSNVSEKTGLGYYVVPINEVKCFEYIKHDSKALPDSSLSKDEIKNAYCIDPVKDHAVTNSESGYYIIQNYSFNNQMLNGLVQATKEGDAGAVSGVRTIALPNNGVQSVGECPTDNNPKGLDQDMTCRFWRGLDPGNKSNNIGWNSTSEYSLKAFDSGIMNSVVSIRNAAKNTGTSPLVNYNTLANIKFASEYKITNFNNCENKKCEFDVTFENVIPNNYDKNQVLLNTKDIVADCSVSGKNLNCHFSFDSKQLEKLEDSIVVASVELQPIGDAGVALLLVPEKSNVSKQRLIIVDKTPKWLQFSFKIQLEKEPCDEFYELIENNTSVDEAWKIIKKKYNEEQIEECCLYPDAKDSSKYVIRNTEKGVKFFDKYCSCDFLLNIVKDKFSNVKDETEAWSIFKNLQGEEKEYMSANLRSGKQCCFEDYIPPSKYQAGYIENAHPIVYNALCDNSWTFVLNNNKKTISGLKTADELESFLKEKIETGGIEDDGALCCDDIKIKMNQSGAPEVYKKYYEEKCQSCKELVEKVQAGGSLNADDKKYFKEHSCCDSLTNEEKKLPSVKDICPQPETCTVTGFELHCDPENTSQVDNYLVYEAYNGNPTDKYSSAYDHYGGCVVDVDFNREAYLDNNGHLDYEIEGQKRFKEADANGNSYYLNDYNSNRYCRISCSERWEFQFSAFQNFVGQDSTANNLTGTYFDLTKDLYLKGQTNCVTTYIDYELYVEQMKAYSKAERAAYNTYQEANVLLGEASKGIATKDDYWNKDDNGNIIIVHNQEGDHGFDDKWCIVYKTESTTGTVSCAHSVEYVDPETGKKKSKCDQYKKDFVFECEEYGDCDQGFARNTKDAPVSVYSLENGANITTVTRGGAVATNATTRAPHKEVSCGSTPESCPTSASRGRTLDKYGVESAYETCELRKFMKNQTNIDEGKEKETVDSDYMCAKGTCSGTFSYEGFDANGNPTTIYENFSLPIDQVESSAEAFRNRSDVQGLMESTVAKKLADAETQYVIDKLKYSTAISDYTLICPYKFTLGQEYEFVIEGDNAGKIYVTGKNNPYTSMLTLSINDYESVCCDTKYDSMVAANNSLKNACLNYKKYGGGCNGNQDNNNYGFRVGYGLDNKKIGMGDKTTNDDKAKLTYVVNPNYNWEASTSSMDSDCVLLGSGEKYDAAMQEAEGRVNGVYKSEITSRANDMAACQQFYITNTTAPKNFPDMSGGSTSVLNFNYSDPKNFSDLSSFKTEFDSKTEYYLVSVGDMIEIKTRTIDSAIPIIYNPSDTRGNNNGLGILLNKHDATNNVIINTFDPKVDAPYLPKATYGYDETDYMKMLGVNNFIVTDNQKNERLSGLKPGDFNKSGGEDAENGQNRVLYINKLRTLAYQSSSPWANGSSSGKQYSGNLIYDSEGGGKITADKQRLYLCAIGTGKAEALKAYNQAGSTNLFHNDSPMEEACYSLDLYYYPVNYIKQSITNSSFYENYGNFYFGRKEDGSIVSMWAKDFSEAKSEIGSTASSLARDRVGVFPISFASPVGIHSYRYWFVDIGTYFNENGRLGRIMSVNTNNVDSKYRGELGKNSGNGNSVVEYSGHICYYELFEQYCACCGKEIEVTIYEHEGYDDPNGKLKDEIEKKIDELGEKYASQSRNRDMVNSSTSGGTLGYYASTVSLNDLKNLTGNWSDSTNILYDGELHNMSAVGGALGKEISEFGENAYANLSNGDTRAEYSYTLTPSVIKQIRESNGSANRYVRNNTKYGLNNLVAVENEGIPYNQTDYVEGNPNEEPTFVHYKSKYLETLTNEGLFGNVNNVCQADSSSISQVVKKEGIYSQCKFVDYNTTVDINGQNKTFRLPFK